MASSTSMSKSSSNTTQLGSQEPPDEHITPPPPNVLKSQILPIDSGGSIRELWPGGCGDPLPDLRDGLERTISSRLLEDTIEISFSNETEPSQANRKAPPSRFYRTYYETSKTMCSNVNKDTHPQHRQAPTVIIEDNNAFQSIGSFSLPADLTRQRIERHLIWNQAVDPSSFISMFDNLYWAMRRANFHYLKSQRIGKRVSIAEIKTKGLIPATVTAHTKIIVAVRPETGFINRIIDSAWKVFKVVIPVWVRDIAKPANGDRVTFQELAESGADMYLSITEIRHSILAVVSPSIHQHDRIAAKGHDYEWLACGFIPKSQIIRHMPWDGRTLHISEGPIPVRSTDSADPWVFDWKTSMWILDPTRFEISATLSPASDLKRDISENDQGNNSGVRKRVKRTCFWRKMRKFIARKLSDDRKLDVDHGPDADDKV